MKNQKLAGRLFRQSIFHLPELNGGDRGQDHMDHQVFYKFWVKPMQIVRLTALTCLLLQLISPFTLAWQHH